MATFSYDFKLDEDEDIYIDPVTNDFVIAKSDQQHIKDILQSVPGWFKEFPLVGLNPYQYLNGKTSVQALNQSASIQLKGDGYIIGPSGIKISLSPGGFLQVETIDVTRD
jgi:hypothetical protein